VESVLAKDAKDITDIKSPLELRYFPGRFIAWCAAAAVVALGALLTAWHMRRKKERPAPPPLPPHVLAYRELERLCAMNLVAQWRVKEYYVRLSDIVRRYIERRFGLRAPDRTTEEFLAEAVVSGLLDARARTLGGDFLEQCDLVKFARYGPTGDEITRAYSSAKKFVDETKEEEEKVKN